MLRKYLLPLLAVVGVGVGIYAAVQSAKSVPPTQPVSEAPPPPFKAFVAGAGLVEANTENIAIGTQIAGIVSKIYIKIGSPVKVGDPLFTIDDRATRALLETLRAAVQVAEAQLGNASNELAMAESIPDKRALSVEVVDQRRYAAQIAEAQLAQARANFNATATDLERLTVRAPVDGQVLQLKVHLGEFAPTGVLQQPLILMGGVQPLNVRVDVDENDAWRVRADAPAIGFLRGNKEVKTPLKFVRFEPYVIPKVSLTGDPTERVDTRVLQVIYSLQAGGLPIYTGNQMDIYIQEDRPVVTTTALPPKS
jgi:multidrug efflux pump subunit AcrA (membrane-fusion protein)